MVLLMTEYQRGISDLLNAMKEERIYLDNIDRYVIKMEDLTKAAMELERIYLNNGKIEHSSFYIPEKRWLSDLEIAAINIKIEKLKNRKLELIDDFISRCEELNYQIKLLKEELK